MAPRNVQWTVATAGIALLAASHVEAERGPSARSVALHQASPFSASQQELVGTYCVTCHNERLRTAGLSLERIDLDHAGEHAELLEKVLEKLRTHAMPPASAPQPDKTTREAFVAALEQALDRAAATAPNPGRPGIHRLNRTEYANAIRDLVALEIDARSWLPPDDTGYGFDNNADVLSLTPSLLDRYLIAAEKVSQLAIPDPGMRPAVATYQIPYALEQDSSRMSEDLPFGSRGGTSVRHYFPADGEYEISLRLQRTSISNRKIRGMSVPTRIDLRIDGTRVRLFELGAPDSTQDSRASSLGLEDEEDKALVVRVPLTAEFHAVGVSFDGRDSVSEGIGPSRQPATSDAGSNALMALDQVHIAGPFGNLPTTDTPSRRRLFVCVPETQHDEAPCAKAILSTLARRAYRRPVTDRDLRRLVAVYDAERRAKGQTGTFEDGIRAALQYILSDLDFLVRVENEPADVAPGDAYRISDLELASRLSFFLWSSVPDDELLGLGERGRLQEPAVLAQQVRRMLHDQRPNGFLKDFFDQWLTTRNLQAARPDGHLFPEFDENLRRAFQRETELFLESQVRENHSVVDLLTAHYTFLNERLARHYGIPGVYGGAFRRVTYPDHRRAGLLGHGSVLTVTSYANRTSPVLRGKWVLETILGSPPPPPPANVSSLVEDEPGKPPTSVRERLEQHRRHPVCASCHARLDPVGFALENFNAVGKWREREGNTPVNASGTFATGEHFGGPAEFREVLVKHRERFVETLTTKLLTYALGRGVEYYDMPAVRKIMRDAGRDDYRWSSLIMAIVESMPFQMRQADGSGASRHQR